MLLCAHAHAEDQVDIVETIEGDAAAVPTASEAQNQVDIVETVEGDAATVPTASQAAPPSEPPPQFRFAGWARQHFEWTFYGMNQQGIDASATIPRDRLLSRTQLFGRASYQRGRWFEATMSGVLTAVVHEQDAPPGVPFNGINGQQVRTSYAADLNELYLGFFSSALDVRVGQQRVPWGRTDVLSPNDVANARDLRDPLLTEQELRYVPTPMLRMDVYGGPVVFEALVSPVFVPDRFVLYGGNWSAVQPSTPVEYRSLFSLLDRVLDPSLRDQANAALGQTRLPNAGVEGISAGSKLAVNFDGVDVSAYYHYGYDGTPFLALEPAFAHLLQTTDLATANLVDLTPVLRGIDNGLRPYTAEYIRRHHVGLDAMTTVGPFVLRLDAAYQSQRVFYRTDLTSVASPALLTVAAIEYQTGSIDQVILLELIYAHVFEPGDQPLLMYERDSYGAACIVRWTLFGPLSVDVTATWSVQPLGYTATPALQLKMGEFAMKAGAILLGGREGSLGWYYRYNTGAFLQVRYTY